MRFVQPLKPGVSLLIKRVSCPIVPVGIAGAFAAWGRSKAIPHPSPLCLPPESSSISISVGQPIDPVHYKGMNRDAIMDELQTALMEQFESAEKLRRNW